MNTVNDTLFEKMLRNGEKREDLIAKINAAAAKIAKEKEEAARAKEDAARKKKAESYKIAAIKNLINYAEIKTGTIFTDKEKKDMVDDLKDIDIDIFLNKDFDSSTLLKSILKMPNTLPFFQNFKLGY